MQSASRMGICSRVEYRQEFNGQEFNWDLTSRGVRIFSCPPSSVTVARPELLSAMT